MMRDESEIEKEMVRVEWIRDAADMNGEMWGILNARYFALRWVLKLDG